MEELFLGRLEAELQIRLHHQPRLLLVEVAGLALSEQLLSLGIELVVVDAMLDIDGTLQFDTDEATCACRVGQDVGDIGRQHFHRGHHHLTRFRNIRVLLLHVHVRIDLHQPFLS